MPCLEPPWAVRAADRCDAERVADWMARPHVAAAWHQAWSRKRWSAEIRGQREGTYSCPLVASFGAVDIGYLEIYRAARNAIARHHEFGPHDLGIHIAIGEPEFVGRGYGSALLGAIATGLFAAEPGCSRIAAEPDAGSTAAIRALRAAGFEPVGEAVLPHKTALLLLLRRPRPMA